MTASLFDWQNASWQSQLAHVIDNLDTLCKVAGLDKQALQEQYVLPKSFGLRVPHAFAVKVRGVDDPILRQILPTHEEQVVAPDFVLDPLGEAHKNPVRGMLHKYKSRVLLTLTGACAVHCRYCFRQHFDYGANLPKSSDQQAIGDYLKAHRDVDEVVLSGGDPLSLSNRRLGDWLDFFADTNLKTVRLHTRLPVVLPARIDQELLALFAKFPKKLVVVIHTNHSQELDDANAAAFLVLKQAGAVLLNQAVLLRGINDTVAAQVSLSHRLFDMGVLPYYLHLLDKVAGAAHFEVPKNEAVGLYWRLLEELSGYLVPKLVQEQAGHPHKTPVDLYQRSLVLG